MIFSIWHGNTYIKYFLVKKYIILICNLMFIEYFRHILSSWKVTTKPNGHTQCESILNLQYWWPPLSVTQSAFVHRCQKLAGLGLSILPTLERCSLSVLQIHKKMDEWRKQHLYLWYLYLFISIFKNNRAFNGLLFYTTKTFESFIILSMFI